MKNFYLPRDGMPDLVVELGFIDMLRLIFGRQVRATQTVIRFRPAYEAFNIEANPTRPLGL